MDETPRHAPPQSGLYTTIALYAAANALSLAVFLILYHVSAVLADFRDPMLYAFLCSIALRGPKDWLVERMDWQLSQDRSLIMTILTAFAPPFAAQLVWAEGQEAVRAFRVKVKEIRDEYQRNMQRGKKAATPGLKQDGSSAAATTTVNGSSSPTPSSPPRPASSAPLPQMRPFALTVYAKAGLRTLTSRKDRKKRRKRGASAVPKRSPAPASNRLLAGLVLLTLAWTGFEWVRDSWSKTGHVVLLSALVLALVTIILRSVLLRTASLGSIITTPSKTPATGNRAPTPSGTAPPNPQSPRGRGWATTPRSLKQPVFGESPRTSLPAHGDPWHGRAWQLASRGFHKFGKFLAVVESPLRAVLRKNIHALVTLVLIVGLLIGTAGTAAFLSVRIASEARGVVAAARDAFPAAWPGVAAVTPLLGEELTGHVDDVNLESVAAVAATAGGTLFKESIDGTGGLGGNGNSAKRSLQQVASEVPLPPWLEAYRQDAMALAQRSLPGMAAWLEGRIQVLMRAHNLTDTLWDARLLYEAAQGPRECSERERGKLLVALAKTEVTARQAREEDERASAKAAEAQRALTETVGALAALMEAERKATVTTAASDGPTSQSCAPKSDGGGETAATSPTCSTANKDFTETPSTPPSAPRDSTLAQLQEAVVAADGILVKAKEVHKAAAAALDDAERARRVAESRSQLCMTPEAAGLLAPAGNRTTQGIVAGVGARLGTAYEKLFWQWHIREGLSELRSAVIFAVNSITQRSGSSAAADLSRLQRLVQAAAVPLFGLGRAAAASVSTTTAAAVMGSLGLFRLGLGVVHMGVQAALFLTLLYYLLSAQTDPLARAVGLLPLPPAARLRAAEALNAALGGVFMSMLKLAAFHGLFAWVTFRMFGAPMAYTCAVASAAFALLPFVPTYAVALPGCAVVALQGRVAAAVALLIFNFSAYYIGDTVVLEDSGGHPFMMSLAILGGLWAFSNPLLGCLLGPTLLSLLSALGSLHTELMSSGGAGSGGHGMLLSPAAPGVVRRPPPILVSTPGNQLVGGTVPTGQQMSGSPLPSPRRLSDERASPAAPAVPTSPQTRGAAVSDSPQRRGASPRSATAESVSLVGLAAKGELSGGVPAVGEDGEDDEVQSELRNGTRIDKDGFTFPKKKENVKFDPMNCDFGL